MTPIRKDLVERKISLIQDDLEKLSRLKDFSLNEIVSDFMKQAMVELLLE